MDEIADKRIMIVGRDSHFSYLLQRFVRSSAHRVVSANIGDDILSIARYQKPVAIVLELDMPETGGWHMLRSLKADPEAGRIPVIVCSWLDESVRGLAEGADVYLRMPFLYEEFGAALAAILKEEENGENR